MADEASTALTSGIPAAGQDADLQAQPSPSDEPTAPLSQDDAEQPDADAPTPPAWAALTSPDELFEHEEIAPKVKEREDAAFQKGVRENRRVQAAVDRQNAQLQEYTRIANEIGQSFADMVENKFIDQDELNKIFKRNPEAVAALGRIGHEGSYWQGLRTAVQSIAAAAKNEGLGEEFLSRMELVRNAPPDGQADGTYFDDLVGQLVKAAKKPLEDEIRELKAKTTRLDVERKAAEKNGQPQAVNALPGRGGGTRTYTMADIKKMSAEQISRIPMEQLPHG